MTNKNAAPSPRFFAPTLFAVKIIRRFLLAATLASLGFTGLFAADSRPALSVTTSTVSSDGLLAGFTIGPGPTQAVLLRAVGPSLAVPGAIADPVLTLYDHTLTAIDRNDHWLPADAPTFTRAGASAFAPGSQDSALVTTLAPGSYTAHVASADASPGLVRLELFPLDGPAPRFRNVSVRLHVGAGPAPVVHFAVSANQPARRLLLRAAGPALAAFGLTGTLPNPTLRLTAADTSTTLAANDDWSSPPTSSASSAPSTATAPALAQAFARAGAFTFPPASADAALLLDLAPGDYSLHVADTTGAAGLALVEIYDLTDDDTPRLLASTAKPAAATPPERSTAAVASAPPYHSADTNQDFSFNLLELTRVIELYNTRLGTTRTGRYRLQTGTEDGFASDPLTADNATVTLAAYHSADSNRDGKISLFELTRIIELYNTRRGTVRTGELHVDRTTEDGFASGALPLLTLAATDANADEAGANPGEFTVTRLGDRSADLTVDYTVAGTATSATDFTALTGTVVIPAGSASAKIVLTPAPDVVAEEPETVTVTLSKTATVAIGAPATVTATVTIADSPTTLYVATLRPESDATASIASGTATLLLSASGTLASINVSFSNLSSDQTSAHLRIAPTGEFVGGLARGSKVTGATWRLTPSGPFTSADLLAALRSGKIFVGIDSTAFPAGELRGTFLQGSGSTTFIAPAAPPAVALTNVTATDAARLLTQATFGPTKAEIDSLTGGSIDTWLTTQLALPFTSHRSATVADRTTFGGSGSFTNWNAIHAPNRQSAWFKTSLTAPDQLRQRVAFALSQILVISDVSLGDDNQAEPLAHYYDQLGNGAFGNFRTLLETVTLSPMMGLYLSSLRNSKATFDGTGATLTTPDENYAREVMQLFTIGLSQLQPDGTLALGADGLPVATYDQTTITEMAKVFTGWAYPSTNLTQFRTATRNYIAPMQLFPSFHDDTAKNLSPVTTTLLPAGQGGTLDLKAALDALFNHPNTGPFLSKQLIQRLVTSNPSPAYVYRVSQKFNDNGSGVRGDLAAVVRAILTDYEARSPVVAANVTFGKLKEPLLRLTALLRAFNASSTSGRFLGYRVHVNGTPIDGTTPVPATSGEITTVSSATRLDNLQGSLAQAALRSPTVFNFFHPDYILPGPLAAAGLVTPEFEITDDNYSISVPNLLRTYVNAVIPTSGGVPTAAAPYVLLLDLTYEQTLVATPSALLDHLNLLLCAGTLPAAAKTRITTALAALPAATTTLDRAKSAVLLVLTSPAAAIQK